MNKKVAWILLGLLVLLIIALIIVGIIQKKMGPISIPDMKKIEVVTPDIQDPLVSGLTAPAGFDISVYAKNIGGARVIAFDPLGRMLVTQTDEGVIRMVEDVDRDGLGEKISILKTGLKKPHGLVFDCDPDSQCYLYVAEADKLVRYVYNTENPSLSLPKELLRFEYSSMDRHDTRTLVFLPPPDDHILLISVGSTCNVCVEKGKQAGKIWSYNTTTGEAVEYASGLRNAVFMAVDPKTGKVIATEMGRDGLGDDTPPDEINMIEKGKHYGWPYCYGNSIHDDEFDKNALFSCDTMTLPLVNLQAHSAPLGLAFTPVAWGKEYQGDVLVAYHGSWNRSIPTGYKLVRIIFDGRGNPRNIEDFVTGWLTSDGKKTGRPVDVVVGPDGNVYVSDDSAGAIYKITKQ